MAENFFQLARFSDGAERYEQREYSEQESSSGGARHHGGEVNTFAGALQDPMVQIFLLLALFWTIVIPFNQPPGTRFNTDNLLFTASPLGLWFLLVLGAVHC